MSAALDSTDVTKNELAAEVLQSYRESPLRVSGLNVLPVIRSGDIVTRYLARLHGVPRVQLRNRADCR